MSATPATCPHELAGRHAVRGFRRREGSEAPTHVLECVRCGTKVYAVLERSWKQP